MLIEIIEHRWPQEAEEVCRRFQVGVGRTLLNHAHEGVPVELPDPVT